MKKIRELNIRIIFLLQIATATVISLLFQFVFPLTWQPLDFTMYGPNIKHGDYNMNFVIVTVSLWYFSFSIAWLLYQDNPYVNNFLIYSLPTLFLIAFMDLFYYHLFWDFIHFTPLVVGSILLWKKRDTLHQRWLPYYLIFLSVWIYSVYFLHLAYFLIPLTLYTFNYIVVTSLAVAITFTFPDNFISKLRRKR